MSTTTYIRPIRAAQERVSIRPKGGTWHHYGIEKMYVPAAVALEKETGFAFPLPCSGGMSGMWDYAASIQA